MKLCVILFFLGQFPLVCFGQTSISDSLEIVTREQKLLHISSQKIDSVQALFIDSADSLRQAYQDRLMKIDSAKDRLEATLTRINSVQSSLVNSLSATQLDSMQKEWKMKVDSLTLFNEHATKISNVLDSVRAIQEKCISDLNTKIQNVKQKTIGMLNDPNLPPQLTEKVSKVSNQINEFQIHTSDFSVPDPGTINALEIDLIKDLDLPLIQGLNVDKLGDLKNMGDLSNVSNIAGELQEHVSALQEVTIANAGAMEAIENFAESHAAELTGLGEIEDQTEKLNEVKDLTEKIKDPDSIKGYAIEQAKDIALDHFAGKEEQLNEAIQTLARYKSKYPNLNGISEATRRPPNEMKDKPLIERIIPGVGMQIQKKGNDLMVDFSPYVSYRITGRVSAGFGWNQRIAYNVNQSQFNALANIFGPRLFGEFKLWRGFSPRAELETMNTLVPSLVRSHSGDPLHREWVWGAFAGIKKEYKLIRNVKGTASVMMRLYNPDRKSPYADVVNARFGFEFPFKRN